MPREFIRRFLTRRSIFEVVRSGNGKKKEGELCTVKNGYDFALRYRLDEVQHPTIRAMDTKDGGKKVMVGKDDNNSNLPLLSANSAPDLPKWASVVAASRLPPSCSFAGGIAVPQSDGGDQWLDTAMHLAEAALIFNQPTVFLKPSGAASVHLRSKRHRVV